MVLTRGDNSCIRRESHAYLEKGTMNKKILVVGLACVDIINVVEDYPKEDSDQRVADCYWQRGGNAANTSCVLSLLGADVEFLGTLSRDREAEFLRETFVKYNVNTDHCVVVPNTMRTPISFVIINRKNGSRTILHHGKNWQDITYGDFRKLDLSLYRWIHFQGRPCCDDIKKCLAWIDDYNKSVESPTKVITSVEIEKPNRPGLDDLFNKSDVVFVSKDYVRSKGFSTKEDGIQNLYSRCRCNEIQVISSVNKGFLVI